MQKSGSRIPAPVVGPVSVAGVRYEQIRNGLAAGLGQMGGYLGAYDETSGRQLWTLKVYDNPRMPGKEGDVQDVFFVEMKLDPGDTVLLLSNEKRQRFRINLADLSVAAAV